MQALFLIKPPNATCIGKASVSYKSLCYLGELNQLMEKKVMMVNKAEYGVSGGERM